MPAPVAGTGTLRLTAEWRTPPAPCVYERSKAALSHAVLYDSIPSIAQILESIRALSADQRAHVRSLLDAMESATSQEAFANHMKTLDLLTRTQRSRPTPDTVAFEPAPTRGTPASDMITENRR